MNNILTIEEIDIRELRQYKNNPRISEDAVQFVANSIREFGFKVPIVANKDYVIVSGHTRYRAAQLLNLKSVPCIVATDLTEQQVKAFRLADNKSSEFAKWDFKALENELNEITDLLMSDFGFKMPEVDIDEFFEETEQKEKESKQIVCPHCGLPIAE